MYKVFELLKFNSMLRYFNFEPSFKLRWYRARDLLEHVYMRSEVNSNRFEKSFHLRGDFTTVTCK